VVVTHLEQADLAAERWLGNVQDARGTGKAAQFCDTDKILKLLKIHIQF
jgi:hypothetical protein